jgi:NADPH:quinone reductase-like Zn-dependent oxidoreductase
MPLILVHLIRSSSVYLRVRTRYSVEIWLRVRRWRRDLVHGALAARGSAAQRRGDHGADVVTAEGSSRRPPPPSWGVAVSVLLDPRGANTTAAAAVVRLAQDGAVRGRRALVLGGAGPVGIRLAGLLAQAGAEVISVPRRDRARDAAGRIRAQLGLRSARSTA